MPSKDSVSKYYQNARKEIAPLLPKDFDSILEIGCGAGETMAWIRSIRDVRYAAGVELFGDAAEIARSSFDDVEVTNIDVAKYNFRESSFDVILALDVLEHLPHPEITIKNLFNKIKIGGIFIASIPNIAHYSVSLPLFIRGLWEYQDEGLLDKTHLHFFNRRSAQKIFTDTGLEIVGVNVVHRVPNIFNLQSHPNRIIRWRAEKIMLTICRWPRHLFDYQFLIAARRPDAF